MESTSEDTQCGGQAGLDAASLPEEALNQNAPSPRVEQPIEESGGPANKETDENRAVWANFEVNSFCGALVSKLNDTQRGMEELLNRLGVIDPKLTNMETTSMQTELLEAKKLLENAWLFDEGSRKYLAPFFPDSKIPEDPAATRIHAGDCSGLHLPLVVHCSSEMLFRDSG
jgi:hypothetical protein